MGRTNRERKGQKRDAIEKATYSEFYITSGTRLTGNGGEQMRHYRVHKACQTGYAYLRTFPQRSMKTERRRGTDKFARELPRQCTRTQSHHEARNNVTPVTFSLTLYHLQRGYLRLQWHSLIKFPRFTHVFLFIVNSIAMNHFMII